MEKFFQDWKVLYRPFDEEDDPYDVLIWFEPPFNCTIEPSFKCRIVFTSHLYLNYKEPIIPFYFQNSKHKQLINTFERNTLIEDILLKPTPFRDKPFTEIYKPSIVYIDLTHCKDIYTIYLCFLNAIENLQYYSDYILKWYLSANALKLLQSYYYFSKNWKINPSSFDKLIAKILKK